MTLRCVVWILTVLLLCTLPIAADAAAPISLEGCPAPGLAKRTGSPSCFAQLSLSTSGLPSSVPLCLSESLWLEWLNRASLPCGTWKGRWQSYSPALNDPMSPALGKHLVLRFVATNLPPATPGRSWTFLWQRNLERLRQDLDEWLKPRDDTGVLSLLATGTHRPGGVLEFLLMLGFVHVLSASGIHLYAMARWWSWCFEKSAQKLKIPLRWALPLSVSVTFVSWTLTWLIAGARPGMLRPWLVVILRKGARRLGMRWQKGATLGIALGIDLGVALFRHDASFQSGRWIYALACAGGLMARSAPSMAVGSWLLAALWQGWHEGLVAVGTPLVSALTLPVFSVAIYPLIFISYLFKLSGFTALAAMLANTLGGITHSMLHQVTGSILKFSMVWLISRGALLAGMTLGTLCFFIRVRFRLGVLLGLAAFRFILPAPAAATAPPLASYVEQLDIGQGDAALVAPAQAGTGFGLIDSGPEQALSDRTWLELLARRGVREIAWVGITHLDEDHSGGIKRLARLLPIRCVATAQGELDSDRGKAYQSALERMGVRVVTWEQGCVPYPDLAPEIHAVGKANENMGAVFIPLASGGFYLSAGDADAGDEPRIGQWAHALADKLGMPRILKISHHGSKTSSNPRFIELVGPSEAWISAGVGNHYGHPALSVLEELSAMGIPVRRTDERGSLRTPPREGDAHHPQ